MASAAKGLTPWLGDLNHLGPGMLLQAAAQPPLAIQFEAQGPGGRQHLGPFRFVAGGTEIAPLIHRVHRAAAIVRAMFPYADPARTGSACQGKGRQGLAQAQPR